MAKEFRYDTDFLVITTTTGKVHGYDQPVIEDAGGPGEWQ